MQLKATSHFDQLTKTLKELENSFRIPKQLEDIQFMLIKHNLSLYMELHRLLKTSLFIMRKANVLHTILMKRPHPKSRSNTMGISLTLVIFLSKSLQHIVDLCLSDTVLAKTYYTISTLSWICWIYQPGGLSILAWMVQL